MSEAILLEARNLVKHFGQLRAVDGLSLQVKRGDVLGVLGPNGAGKSTTMKMMTGFLRPTSGTTEVAGSDIAVDPLAAKHRIGYLPEGAPAYGEMSVIGFLRFVAAARGIEKNRIGHAIDRVMEAVDLGPVASQAIDTLSKGFRRRVGLAQALVHDPDVLILDEPTDGLDPNQKFEVRSLISKMAPDKAIVISTHILEEVDAICSRAIIIAKGKIVADGTPEALHRRAKTFGEIRVRAATEVIDALAAKCGDLASLADMIRETDGSSELLRLKPTKPQSLLSDVQQLIQTSSLAVDELTVDPGRLDDVFRDVTMGLQNAMTPGEGV
ncbi:MAG: ABC transporter ATP-binding protein [Pseudomonadota bacterium]